MRIYSDCLEMVKEVERDLFEMGLKVKSATVQDRVVDGDEAMTMELNGYCYKIISRNNEFLKKQIMCEYMNLDIAWIKADFLERVDQHLINPGKAYLKAENLWGKYVRDGLFQYTYNERIRDQLEYVIFELSKRPNSRQGVITIYDQHNDMRNWGGKARVPCSMYYQFIIRNDKLNLFYTMRSCDFLKHFVGDVALAISLQGYVAKKLGYEVGGFTHFIGSLHSFYKDMKDRGIF